MLEIGISDGHRLIIITTELGGDILVIRGGIGIGVSATILTIIGGAMDGVRVGIIITIIPIGVGVPDIILRITEWVVRHITIQDIVRTESRL